MRCRRGPSIRHGRKYRPPTTSPRHDSRPIPFAIPLHTLTTQPCLSFGPRLSNSTRAAPVAPGLCDPSPRVLVSPPSGRLVIKNQEAKKKGVFPGLLLPWDALPSCALGEAAVCPERTRWSGNLGFSERPKDARCCSFRKTYGLGLSYDSSVGFFCFLFPFFIAYLS